MADEKSNMPKKDPDSKKTGNSCGFSLGCLVIIIAIAAVIFFLFIKPKLDNAGYSYGDLKEKVLNLKNKADNALERTDKLYQDGKEKYNAVKDKAGEHWDELKDLDAETREKLDKNAPKLIAD